MYIADGEKRTTSETAIAPPRLADDEENEADNEEDEEDNSENESESENSETSANDTKRHRDDASSPPQRNDETTSPKMTVSENLSPARPVTPVTPGSPAINSFSTHNEDVKNEVKRPWTNGPGPINGLTKLSESTIMDLSAKRRRSDSDDSEPEIKIAKRAETCDFTLPLDLSQKSSRPRDEPKRNRPITPVTSHQQPTTTPISPSLATLQKKFGGYIPSPKTPVDIARGTVESRVPVQPVHHSARNLWYSNVYRQSLAPYSTLFTHSKLPYYPGLTDIPLHASFPALAAAASGMSESHMSGLGGNLSNLKHPKATNHHSVAMTTKSQPSINPSPSKSAHKSLSHVSVNLPPKHPVSNQTPPIPVLTSPSITSPRNVSGPPMSGFDIKDLKTNCIDFKCDCGKAYTSLYELSVHMQDTGHMPRHTKAGPSGDYPKLVRGQDMWLNNGLEQTKQILRCMHCGESFKTLPELTVHMMKTQHYADIFSSAHRKLHKCTTFFEKENDTKSVFKCRVCENEFDSLDSLANHMVESRHHRRSSRSSASIDDPIKIRQSLIATMKNQNDCDSHSDTSPLTSPDVNRRLDAEKFQKSGENFHDISRDRHHTSRDERPESRDAHDVTSPVTESRGEPHTPPRDEIPPRAQNGDVNHNTDDVEKLKNVKMEVTSEKNSLDTKPKSTTPPLPPCGRDSPLSDIGDEGEHNIKCENCFERIKTDLFVEHVRHCISKDRKSVTSSKPVMTSPTPSERPQSLPDATKKQGSALKAMEKFIENFSERKHKNSHNAPMSSLLYDYVGPMGNSHGKPRSPGDDNGRVSPMDSSSSKPLRMPMYMDRMTQDHSALHNLYRFASFGSRNQAHSLSRLPESPSRHNMSRSPPISPKHSSVTSSHSDDVRRLTSDDVRRRPDTAYIGQIDTSPRKRHRSNDIQPERHSVSPRHNDVKRDVTDVISPHHSSPRSHDMSPPITTQEHDTRPPSTGAPPVPLKSPSPHHDTTLPTKPFSPGNVSNVSNVSTTPDINPVSPKTSALDSLKGLVDKQMDKEHPLNSLQKLINQTDGNNTNNVSSLQSRLINVTSSPYWFSFSHLTKGWPNGGASSTKSDPDRAGAELENVVDSDGIEVNISELKCDLCGKLFSSRGGCRYHRSKCPQSVPKNLGSKEAHIVQTPYTYMPLEHTNKFSKYYEMARELANKSN